MLPCGAKASQDDARSSARPLLRSREICGLAFTPERLAGC